jgi:sugar phosphate isomerase/epimerase
MAPKIALQLYTLRQYTPKDYEGVIRKVAAMGYDGVETAGFEGTTAKDAAKLFKELGLSVAGAHSQLPIGDKKSEVIETSLLFGCKYVAVATTGPNDVKDMDAIKHHCEQINQGQANAKAAGLGLTIHNHWWEYARLDGRLIADIMVDLLDPAVLFELDTYWIKTAGVDPAEIVRLRGKRAPLLHIKDGPCKQGVPQNAVGEGVMDIPALLKAGGSNTEWWIMEADEVAGDAFEAVRRSQIYMKGLVK